MEDDVLYIIENTEKAQNDFGRRWGCGWYQITMDQINELVKGKQLAFSDGEYTHFISLTIPEKQED